MPKFYSGYVEFDVKLINKSEFSEYWRIDKYYNLTIKISDKKLSLKNLVVHSERETYPEEDTDFIHIFIRNLSETKTRFDQSGQRFENWAGKVPKQWISLILESITLDKSNIHIVKSAEYGRLHWWITNWAGGGSKYKNNKIKVLYELYEDPDNDFKFILNNGSKADVLHVLEEALKRLNK